MQRQRGRTGRFTGAKNKPEQSDTDMKDTESEKEKGAEEMREQADEAKAGERIQ